MSHQDMNRREALKAAGATGAGLALAALATSAEAATEAMKKGAPHFENAWFYDKDGAFIEARGKEAYIKLMRFHGFPVFPGIEEKLWVSDYGIGEFTSLGLGANMYINRHEEHPGDRYMLMDLFLLPGQMLPEHYHLESEIARPKMESWFVRHGSSHIIGEGPETAGIKDMMPKSQRASATVFNAKLTGPGEFASLNRATARHAQIAGPDGCIMSEVANYHDNDAVRHTNPKLVFP